VVLKFLTLVFEKYGKWFLRVCGDPVFGDKLRSLIERRRQHILATASVATREACDHYDW